MSDFLVIVESPAKAKTIKRYLGNKYTVKASMGHIRDLPKSQMGIDFENNYKPKYITIRGKGPILKELKAAAKKAKKVFLAADPDREGEAIAWHLANSLDLDINSKCRVVFNEITEDAIKESFKHPRSINMDLVNAQQARRVLDRAVGYSISPLLWKKVKKGLSAGRVQSVAVRLIIDREKEIKEFKQEEYWTVTGRFLKGKTVFEAELYGYAGEKEPEKIELKTEEDVKAILEKIEGNEFKIVRVSKKERRRNPAPPFTTSSLQQEAARKLNFRAKKTMTIAQQLYEGIDLGKEGTVGLITYMRTDSTRISETARKEAAAYIETTFGKEYLYTQKRVAKKANNAQDAHEAIRPTSVMREPDSIKEYLTRDQYRLYRLIWERFVASQMAPAVMDTMSVDLLHGDILFRASGSKIKFQGFMKVYIEGTDDNNGNNEENKKDNMLPDLNEGDIVFKKDLEPKQHFTQPPPRYTEARLVKTLEELGIGRPSTYAPTIDTIQKRGYVALENKRFVPTELGEVVVKLMMDYFPDIIDIEFTAQMEKNLDEIEEGKVQWVTVVDDFYRKFSKDLEVAEKEIEKIEIKDEPAGEDCELCGHPMVYKMGKYGKFLACSNFPECRHTKPILRQMGVKCPKCGEGNIVERKSKKQRRVFYGCDRYPQCDYVSWDKPVPRKCPKCEGLLVEKKSKNGLRIQCVDCDYTEEPS